MAIAKPIPTISEAQIARFWSFVDQSGECWLWKGSITNRGYGQVYIGGRMFKAHRVAWTLTNGPIPSDLPLDHLCRNHGCVNPSHLEAVPHKENVRRGESPTAANSAKTHCSQGHLLAGDNIVIYHYPGHVTRRCLTCRRLRISLARAAGQCAHCPNKSETYRCADCRAKFNQSRRRLRPTRH